MGSCAICPNLPGADLLLVFFSLSFCCGRGEVIASVPQ